MKTVIRYPPMELRIGDQIIRIKEEHSFEAKEGNLDKQLMKPLTQFAVAIEESLKEVKAQIQVGEKEATAKIISRRGRFCRYRRRVIYKLPEPPHPITFGGKVHRFLVEADANRVYTADLTEDFLGVKLGLCTVDPNSWVMGLTEKGREELQKLRNKKLSRTRLLSLLNFLVGWMDPRKSNFTVPTGGKADYLLHTGYIEEAPNEVTQSVRLTDKGAAALGKNYRGLLRMNKSFDFRLLSLIPFLPLAALPMCLTHENSIVRKAAKKRAQELQGGTI